MRYTVGVALTCSHAAVDIVLHRLQVGVTSLEVAATQETDKDAEQVQETMDSCDSQAHVQWRTPCATARERSDARRGRPMAPNYLGLAWASPLYAVPWIDCCGQTFEECLGWRPWVCQTRRY